MHKIKRLYTDAFDQSSDPSQVEMTQSLSHDVENYLYEIQNCAEIWRGVGGGCMWKIAYYSKFQGIFVEETSTKVYPSLIYVKYTD